MEITAASITNHVRSINATITSIPVKSGYESVAKESNGTVDAVAVNEINEYRYHGLI